jgi:2-dehydropantoate 2-reductase
MKWLCFGAGAVGTYLGGSLALAGERVVFVERPAAAAELRQRGLVLDLTGDKRRRSLSPIALEPQALMVAESLEEALESGPFDLAIYALKSFDTQAALRDMAPFVPILPPVCCFSNGVYNEPALASALGADRVIPATVTTAIGRRGPGSIVLEKLRGIGIASSHPLSPAIMLSANSALLNARLYSNAVAMKWSKLFTNLIANPTSAILDMTPAEIFDDSSLYRLEIAGLRECLAVMRAQHIPVVDLPGVPVRALAAAVRFPPLLSRPLLARALGGGRGAKMPSFHIDLHAGRRESEVEYLQGAVAAAGAEHGVPTPVNAFLTGILMALTVGTIPLAEYARQPRKLIAAFESRQQL